MLIFQFSSITLCSAACSSSCCLGKVVEQCADAGMDAGLQTESIPEMVDYGRASMVRQQVIHKIKAFLPTPGIKHGLETVSSLHGQSLYTACSNDLSYGAGIQQ